jgi:hypothetical protein
MKKKVKRYLVRFKPGFGRSDKIVEATGIDYDRLGVVLLGQWGVKHYFLARCVEEVIECE